MFLYSVCTEFHFIVFKEREQNNPGRKFIATSQRDKDISKVLESVATQKNSTITGIALAYVFHKTPYVFPIIGGRTVDHLKGNIEALSIQLSEEDIKKIETGYEFDTGFPHNFLSGSLFEGENIVPRTANGPADVWLTKHGGTFDWVEAPKPIKPAVLDK